MKGIIYGVKNNKTGKFYIGQTTSNLETRKKSHEKDSKNNCGYYLHNSIKKHGAKNFKWFIIGEFNDLDDKERFHIKKYNSLSPNGYNLTTGGQKHFKLIKDTKKKCQFIEKVLLLNK